VLALSELMLYAMGAAAATVVADVSKVVSNILASFCIGASLCLVFGTRTVMLAE
jgi:fatty-acid desaturase